jgi:hypothetical protein
MNTLVKSAGMLALAGAVALASAVPASAQYYWGYHPYYHDYYYDYPGYYHRHYYYDPGAAVAAGIIGGVFGAIAGGVARQSYGGSHVWRCAHTYRSYQPSTDTFMGYDGVRHLCRL